MISYSPIGRGSTISKANVETIFNTAIGLISQLKDENFADNAGISEAMFQWTYHNHAYGSIGDGVITNKNLKHNSFDGVEYVRTITPGCVAIPGKIFISLNDGKYKDTTHVINFASTSYTSSTFQPGTVPVILTTVQLTSSTDPVTARGMTKLIVSVYDITADSFTVRIQTAGLDTTLNGYLHYLALGVSPGFLVNPEVK